MNGSIHPPTKIPEIQGMLQIPTAVDGRSPAPDAIYETKLQRNERFSKHYTTKV